MNGVPSSTYFTVSPEWGWLITLYFFFGGLAGGAYFLAALIDFFGQPEDRPLARLGPRRPPRGRGRAPHAPGVRSPRGRRRGAA